MASTNILLTNFTTGASSTPSLSVVSPSSVSSSGFSKPTFKSLSEKLPKLCMVSAYTLSIRFFSLLSSTTIVSTDRRELKAIASMASTRVGSLSATNSLCPRLNSGSALNLRTIFSSTKSLGIVSVLRASRSNKGSPKACDNI